MVKGDAVVEVGQNGGVGGDRWREWKASSVERLRWRGSCAGHDWWLSCVDVNIGVAIHADGAVCEDGSAVVVAYGANG